MNIETRRCFVTDKSITLSLSVFDREVKKSSAIAVNSRLHDVSETGKLTGGGRSSVVYNTRSVDAYSSDSQSVCREESVGVPPKYERIYYY